MATNVYKLVETKSWHCKFMKAHLRPMDRKEFKVFLGMNAKDGIDYSQRVATKSWTAFYEGFPACIVGYSVLSVIGQRAAPFLYGSEVLDRRPYVFAKYSRPVNELLKGFSMSNWVLDENRMARNWLTWLGFTVGEPIEMNGHLVRPFERKIEECVYQWPLQSHQLRLLPSAR